MSACRWNGRGEPRILTGRHGAECPQEAAGGDLSAEECSGCLPCPDRHCTGDSCRGRNHAEVTCEECLTAARDDLRAIGYMCGAPLLEEVLTAGVESEAAMLLAPAANTDAWQYRAMSAMFGRVDAAYLKDNRDEEHPAWVLGWIENEWREAFDQPTDLRFTIARSIAYIGDRMHMVAGMVEMPNGDQAPEFADAAARLRVCRSHLENVLQEGLRKDKGAPCVQCGRTMTQVTNDRKDDGSGRRHGTEREGAQDAYECIPCRRTVTGDQYRYAVGVAHLAHADRLTADDLGRKLGIKASVVRVWGSRGLVRKRGRTPDGITLYDVADVETRHAGEQESA